MSLVTNLPVYLHLEKCTATCFYYYNCLSSKYSLVKPATVLGYLFLLLHHILPCSSFKPRLPLSPICWQCTYSSWCACVTFSPSLHSTPAELSLLWSSLCLRRQFFISPGSLSHVASWLSACQSGPILYSVDNDNWQQKETQKQTSRTPQVAGHSDWTN